MAKTTAPENLSTSKDQVSREEADRFDFDKYLVRLMWDEPFYAHVLREINKKSSYAVPTAGVAVKDGHTYLYWNPQFVATLQRDEGADKIIGLNIHECLHLVLDHCTGRRPDDDKLALTWNYATDLSINCQIPVDKLPSCGIWPGKEFEPVSDEVRARIGDERADKFDALSKLLESLPPHLSAEEYFSILLKDENASDVLQPNGDEGDAGESGDGPGAPGNGNGSASSDGYGSGMPGGMDDHNDWGEMTEEDRATAKAQIKQAMKDAARSCDAKGSWGSVPAETRELIRKMCSNEIPWQSLIKKFVGMTQRSTRRTSWGKLNKKNPMLVPGSRRSVTASFAVYIDQSGSVGNDELEMLFAELATFAKKTEFTTFHFDTSIDEDSETVWKKGRTPQAHRTRCGGTCFNAVVEHANKNKHRFDGVFILTDGYAPRPKPCRLKVGWVITPSGTTEDWMAGSRNFVIHMKEEKKTRAA